MKNKSNLLLLLILIGGLLFSFLFWNERLALNLLIYSIFILAVNFWNPEVPKSPKFKIYALAHLFAAALVVINNSSLSIATYYLSLLLFIGFSHFPQLRTVFLAIITAGIQIFTVPISFVQHLSQVSIGGFNLKPLFRLIKYIVFPIFIVTVFTAIYAGANDVFNHYTSNFLASIEDFFSEILNFLFQDLSLPRFVHFCFGMFLSAGLIISFFSKGLEEAEMNCKEELIRLRRNTKLKTLWYEIVHTFGGSLITKNLALKTEFIIAIISFSALNLLILFLNLIDITTLWFNYKPSGSFSADLHQGTNALIFSILIAMVVIIYFFRANLNFYSKSKTLRTLAYFWMLQNFILIISVFIKDGYYIDVYGLTHKRIGVLVFATLCIIGLITVYIKVAKQKTLFYLLKVNGSIWFILLLAFSTINWDVFIVKYNFANKDSISFDPDYQLSLSDKTLPILDQNRKILTISNTTELPEYQVAKPADNIELQNKLNSRIGYFKARYEEVSWLSLNLPDWKAAHYFGLNK